MNLTVVIPTAYIFSNPDVNGDDYVSNYDKAKRWNQKHREQRNKINRDYRKKHPEKVKEWRQKYWKNLRNSALNCVGNGAILCSHCGFSNIKAIQIDHINGEGLSSKKGLTTGGFYRRILKMSIEEVKEKYQLLCANCNWIKRVENNEVKKS